jgi:gamma-glutamyltranspeptidase/glutathione hydrolase
MNRRDFVKTLGVAGAMAPFAPSLAAAQQTTLQTNPRTAQIGDMIKPDDPVFEGRAHRAVWGRTGSVAAADMQGSLAGARMLMKGGNAIDAIIATAAALNVAEPYMSGMCGFGGYMIAYIAKEKKVVALDMMGISPKAASMKNMTEQDFDEGYKSPIVPGSIGGWAEALKKYGTLSLGDVFEPAIDLAENGFIVTKYDALSFTGSQKKLAQFPETARVLLPNGRPPREGELLKQPDLAKTFRRVAAEGPDVVYKGEIADIIVKHLRDNGGFMTKEDMAGYAPRWREPISTTFQGYTLYGMPPGSCEMTMFQVLNIMDGFDLKNMPPYGRDFGHFWLEAMKLAFVDDDRYNTGKDVEIPVSRLISKEYAAQQRQRIRRDAVTAHNLPILGTEGTTSFAAADKWGNVVALTQSLVSGFGCGVMVPGTGMMLNNGHRYGFVLEPNHVNSLVGGQHSKGVMCPTVALKDGKAVMGIGASGGYTIPQTVGQAITKALAFGFDVQQAIASPRIMMNRPAGRVPYGPDVQTYTDPSFPTEAIQGLQSRGHKLGASGNAGAVQGVWVDPQSGACAAGSDPRRDGHPVAV